MNKTINLSWLVEKWTLLDEDSYLKSIWLNTESLDIIRINQGETEEDIINNYIDIDGDIENYVLMPTADEFDEDKVRQAFFETLSRHQKDQLIEQFDGMAPREEFLDIIYSLGLEKEFNEFSAKVVAYILLNWAEDERISVNKDMETINIDKLWK